jgi:hypothetical protein
MAPVEVGNEASFLGVSGALNSLRRHALPGWSVEPSCNRSCATSSLDLLQKSATLGHFEMTLGPALLHRRPYPWSVRVCAL